MVDRRLRRRIERGVVPSSRDESRRDLNIWLKCGYYVNVSSPVIVSAEVVRLLLAAPADVLSLHDWAGVGR